MHGLGNDFIVVDLRGDVSKHWFEKADTISALCTRRTGIGADGVLAILDPSSAARDSGAVARMRIRNADGSEAEMCGNGLRCVVRYLLAANSLPTEMRIETASGVLSCQSSAELVEIAMGAPQWDFVQRPLQVADTLWSITAISMGNPHAVIFSSDVLDAKSLRTLAERHGPSIEHLPLFPERTNVEFVCASDRDHYTVAVWERGCGITLACGTGACASAVAACLTGRAKPNRWLTIHLLGGALQILVEPDYRQVHMRGPAVAVYRGEFRVPA